MFIWFANNRKVKQRKENDLTHEKIVLKVSNWAQKLEKYLVVALMSLVSGTRVGN